MGVYQVRKRGINVTQRILGLVPNLPVKASYLTTCGYRPYRHDPHVK